MSLAAILASSKFLALVLDAAFRSLLLGCFLATVLAVFRVRAARAKLIAWRGLLLIAIAMPLLMLLSPAVMVVVPVPSFSRSSATSSLQAPHPSGLHSLTESPIPTLSLDDGRLPPKRGSNVSNAAVIPPQAPVPGFALPRAAQPVSWTIAGTLLYLTVLGFFFARLLIGMYFGARLVRGAQAIDDRDTLNLRAAAARTSGLQKPPRLAESDVVTVPVTLGIFYPTILFPSAWRNWQSDELAAVLAHETSHVARRDSLVQLLALLHRAIFWFSPLSWWLERHLAGLAEQTSDEAALSGGVDRTRYAQALLGFMADLESSPVRVWWHGVAMAKTGEGEKRVERILAWRSAMSKRSSKYLVVALVAVCLPAVALSVAAHPSAYQLQDSTVPAPPSPAAPPPPNQIAPTVAIPVPAAPLAMPVAPSVAPPLPVQVLQPSSAPPLPGIPAVAALVPQQLAQVPSQSGAPPAPPAPPPPIAIAPPSSGGSEYGPGFNPMDDFHWPWGPPFVIVTRGSDHLVMSGSEEDAEHARALRSKIRGDFIWFEHDGKSYIIRDHAIINRAKQIWAQRGDSAKLQQQLQAKEQELSAQMRDQVQQKMQEIRVKIPDMSAELQKLQSEIKNLNAKGATMQELGDLQRQVGELQQSLGEARWNSNMQEINRRAGELGRQMGDLGRQIGEIARREVEQGRQASEQMRQLLDNALSQGLAKPE
ncbi:MAG: M56 family metallopeptidase [Candidatus Acidiferrales bacterium]